MLLKYRINENDTSHQVSKEPNSGTIRDRFVSLTEFKIGMVIFFIALILIFCGIIKYCTLITYDKCEGILDHYSTETEYNGSEVKSFDIAHYTYVFDGHEYQYSTRKTAGFIHKMLHKPGANITIYIDPDGNAMVLEDVMWMFQTGIILIIFELVIGFLIYHSI